MSKQFEDLTPTEKRVRIANDVLKHLNTERLKVKTGVWLKTKQLDSCTFRAKNLDTQLDKVLKNEKSCKVCALGGLFMAAVLRADNITVRDIRYFDDYGVGTETLFKYLGAYFEQSQLRLIEIAFEKGHGYYEFSDKEELRAIKQFKKYDAKKRMRLIMENIIKNDGEFVP